MSEDRRFLKMVLSWYLNGKDMNDLELITSNIANFLLREPKQPQSLLDCFELLNEANGKIISKAFAQKLIYMGYKAAESQHKTDLTHEPMAAEKFVAIQIPMDIKTKHTTIKAGCRIGTLIGRYMMLSGEVNRLHDEKYGDMQKPSGPHPYLCSKELGEQL
ncbi:hypothetical protein [Methylobacter sp. S3L5C]|uniref:hypothetical protein n=1 Tax=Methylobacter sp. S3L5C TaxID=2839024 RepID=UPI001FABB482|nr:hypothetical protein [Methylobacter sp. S3L5C]UOA08361.1 hypothetical protein KKZ03_19495 [Methylobacter sp. S3L5C]